MFVVVGKAGYRGCRRDTAAAPGFVLAAWAALACGWTPSREYGVSRVSWWRGGGPPLSSQRSRPATDGAFTRTPTAAQCHLWR